MVQKLEIVTRADLERTYPGCKLIQWTWLDDGDDPISEDFIPTYKIEFYLSKSTVPIETHFVQLDGVNDEGYQQGYAPTDIKSDAQNWYEPPKGPSFLKNPKTGKWWRRENTHPAWVRARVKALPVKYMRTIPSEMLPARPDMGHVYFVEAGPGGPIKIGWSQEVGRRIEALQIANPHPLKLIGTFSGPIQDEQAMHKRFAHLKMQGEWFQNDGEIKEFLFESMVPSAPIDPLDCETESDASGAEIPRVP